MSEKVLVGFRASPEWCRERLLRGDVRYVPGKTPKTQISDDACELAHEKAQEAVVAGRMIWCGDMPDVDQLLSRGDRGWDLLRAGHIDFPFQEPFILSGTKGKDTWVEVISPVIPGGRGEAFYGIMNAGQIQNGTPADRFMLWQFVGFLTPFGSHPNATMEVREAYQSGWVSTESLGVTALAIVGLVLLMLNTEGVPAQQIQPSQKLNKARLATGKPPLPPYIQIDSQAYITALKGGLHAPVTRGISTHASPVPHVRIGHIRHLSNGREIWVKDCFVNLHKGPPGMRAFYQLDLAAP